MKRQRRKNPPCERLISRLVDRAVACCDIESSTESRVAAMLRALSAYEHQGDPDLPWEVTAREISTRIRADHTRYNATYRHRLLTSVSTDNELLFLDRLYTMARQEATHVVQWSGYSDPQLDEPVQCAGHLLNKEETRAYNALMQMGYDPDDTRNRVDLHTRLVVQMVFHLIGLYKKGNVG